MDITQIIFLVIAFISLAGAVGVVAARNLVHAALWLVLALFGVAGMYVLLEAGFFAVAQVLIYIGAIAILFIFAVMLTQGIMKDSSPMNNAGWGMAAVVAIAFLAGIVYLFWQTNADGWTAMTATPAALPAGAGTLQQLGLALVDQYLLPFEMASVLLVAAMVGAIYVAWGKQYAPESKED